MNDFGDNSNSEICFTSQMMIASAFLASAPLVLERKTDKNDYNANKSEKGAGKAGYIQISHEMNNSCASSRFFY